MPCAAQIRLDTALITIGSFENERTDRRPAIASSTVTGPPRSRWGSSTIAGSRTASIAQRPAMEQAHITSGARLPAIDDYEALVGAETVDRVMAKAARFHDLHLVNVNSTYYGGGYGIPTALPSTPSERRRRGRARQ